MTKNNALRLVLLALCLAAILTSCAKSVEQPGSNGANRAVEKRETLFSRIKFFSDGRKPGVDTVWTLRLTTPDLVATYQPMDGYVYEKTSTYTDRGVVWSRKVD